MPKSKRTGSVATRPSIIWHFVLAGLLLVVVVNFFYWYNRLYQRAERESKIVQSVLVTTPPKQNIGRNLQRWHDSSLIFVAIKNFQAENNGSLPARWDDTLLNPQNDSLASDHEATIQNAFGQDLPDADYFHIWPGYVCSEDQQASYWENRGELTYDQIIKGGDDSDFAVVYGAEEPYDAPDILAYGKCLDSLNGLDNPDFIFKQIELY